MILLALVALAQEPSTDARARELYENGEILYAEGRYEDAIVAFEEAYRLSGRPLLLFNMANAQERLGRWREALDTLSRYRAYAQADERDTLDRRIANLERRLAESPSTTPDTSSSTSSTTTVERRDELPGWARPLPLACLGVGLAGVGTGSVLGGLSLASGADARAQCLPDGDGLTRCPSAAAADVDAERGFALGADIALAVGVAGIATGTALALWGPGGALLAGPGYVGLSGSF